MNSKNVLRLLSRTDKWYLGGGHRLLWAPPFPTHLHAPGFWDTAQYYNYDIAPLFTWSLLESRDEVNLQQRSRRWNPATLTAVFHGADLIVEEQKAILPNDVAIVFVRIKNRSVRRRALHFVAWSVQESAPSSHTSWIDDVEEDGGILSFTKHMRRGDHPVLDIGCALGLSMPPTSFAVNLSEGVATLPQWTLTPFHEQFKNGMLSNQCKLSGVTNDGVVYIALHRAVTLAPKSERTIAAALAVAPTVNEAQQQLAPPLRSRNPIRLSESSWNDYFASVPTFDCSDEFLRRYYWYRWYGLRLNTIYGGDGNYEYPAVCEGIGSFRAPISYSAQCHVLENRWLPEPELAQGSLLTFIHNQRHDGGFRGYIDVNYYRQEMFYHANWGRAMIELYRLHPDAEFLRLAYAGLKRYAAYFDRERDEEVSGLYDIDNHYETGQEFMHRYTAVDPNADKDDWGEVFRLKGVDVTIYMYELKRSLAIAAELLSKNDEADLWNLEADKIKEAVRSSMWDPKEEMFFDIDPKTHSRTNVKAATCFYPYFTDIVDEIHLPGLKRHLLSAKEFWTPFPVPSTSADDETFSAEPEWKGKRMNCPWNGRVWPMTNSHIAEALVSCAIRFHDDLLKKSVEFVTKFIRMMFFDGDPTRPNCFEHYNPFTGTPSVYRGVDDYQHSWVNDLIIKYVCGIRPDDLAVTVDPFPFGLKHAVIDRVHVRGKILKVEIRGRAFSVWLDAQHRIDSTIGHPITFQI